QLPRARSSDADVGAVHHLPPERRRGRALGNDAKPNDVVALDQEVISADPLTRQTNQVMIPRLDSPAKAVARATGNDRLARSDLVLRRCVAGEREVDVEEDRVEVARAGDADLNALDGIGAAVVEAGLRGR